MAEDAISPESVAQGDIATSQDAAPVDTAAPETVTLEQFNALQNRIQQQSALLGQLQNALKKIPQNAPAADPKQAEHHLEPAKTGPTDQATLTALMAKISDMEKAAKDGALLSSVRDSLIQNGVDAAASPFFAKAILANHGQDFEVDGDQVNGFSVGVREAPETLTPVNDWMGAWLQTDTGRALAPTKKAPTAQVSSNAMAVTDRVKMTAADAASADYELLTSGKVEIID